LQKVLKLNFLTMEMFEVDNHGQLINAETFNKFDELKILTQSFVKLGWDYKILFSGAGGYYEIKLNFGKEEFKLNVYLKKITSGGRENRPTEKRVQFGGSIDRKGFDEINEVNTFTAILGIYGQENYEDKIICGWNIHEWGHNEGKAFNCFIDVSAIGNAFKYGMKRHLSSKGQISYAFREEFLMYYLFNTSNLYKKDENSNAISKPKSTNLTPKQKIYFGSPGTGKSTAMQKFAKENDLEIIRTTFHPDTDYHSFVGGYKPIMKDDKITYQFVPQAFTKAYVKAYQNSTQNYLLAIEEINRGNCAQIFGDLFQCLDRKEDGFSCYPIDANADLANYLASQGLENPEELILPPNLLIYATMNTSDQSLFPMDSAFKRRWDWQYVPIEFNEKADKIKIIFDDETQYSWRSFIENVNEKIKEITKSEDKKIGVYFVSVDGDNTISLAQFQNKVMFYLWSEIFKDEHQSAESIFKYLNQDDNAIDFTFNELFEDEGLMKLKGFMNYLLKPIQ
jgi:hypothetical protein